jgi:peptidoglycan/xylan/chitin deacetylase (PgdA/CDA1 family)
LGFRGESWYNEPSVDHRPAGARSHGLSLGDPFLPAGDWPGRRSLKTMKLKIVLVVTGFSLTVAGALAWLLASLRIAVPSFASWWAILSLVVEGVLLEGVFHHRSPVFGRIFWRGAKDLRSLALTFDDGPNERYTPQILDVLREAGVRATFFVVGRNVGRALDVVGRIAREGHELGNHGLSHAPLPLKSPAAIRREIRETAALIREATGGAEARLFRPSHGWRNPWTNAAARREGCRPVSWTLGVWDTSRPGAEAIVRRTLRGLGNGCVLLYHDGRGVEEAADSSQLVEALPVVIAEARRRGYGFLTLSEMMERSGKR